MERPNDAEVKAWERSLAIRKWILGLELSILALGVIALLVIQSGKKNPQLGNSEPVVSSSASTGSASKEYRMLQEQRQPPRILPAAPLS